MHSRWHIGWVMSTVVIGGLAPAWGAEVYHNAVVAIVNDEAITQQDVEAVLFSIDEADKAWQQLTEREQRELGLQQLIEERLILQAARSANIPVEDTLVDERLEAARHRFPSEAQFDRALAHEGLTRAMLRKRYRDQLMMQRAVEAEVRARVVVTPSEINRYYQEHRSDMRSANRVHARHILIRVGADRSPAQALGRAEEVVRRIRRDTPVAQLVATYSEGPEAQQEGDMGWVSPGELRPELDEALFRLGVGEVSDPIPSDLGYHVLYLEAQEPMREWSFEEVEPTIREHLFREKFEAELARWLAELRSKAYIVIKQSALGGVPAS